MEIKLIDLSEIKTHPRNAKLHPTDQVEKIANSIKQFGFNNPIILDASFTILAGHGRFQAAKKLKLKKVPTITLEHLTDAQARAYILADNKVTGTTYDIGLLNEELFDLAQDGFDFKDLGFGDDEMEKLMSSQDEIDRTEEEDNELLDLDFGLRAKHKDVWEIGPHKMFINGNTRMSSKTLYNHMRYCDESLTIYVHARLAEKILNRYFKDGFKNMKKINKEEL
jgi:hypothetical protein